MSFIELFLIAVGLSMDAFAVAICKGLSMDRLIAGHAVIIGLYFGGFQALMPLIGYLLGSQFESLIADFDHWIAFVLLAFIGLRMVQESRQTDPGACTPDIDPRTMLLFSVATSIDALAVGVSLACLSVKILPSIALIGSTTFLLTVAGVYMGHTFGERHRQGAELVGGIILILIGVKILAEHLFFGG